MRIPRAIFLVLAALASGCYTPTKQQTNVAPKPLASAHPLPPIESAYTRNGRGVPYGRSDSSEAYLRAELPIANNPEYGFIEQNPIQVGPRTGDLQHIRYLNSLRGPNGEPIEYERKGSCCPFDTEHAALGGLLDIYRVRIDGSSSEMYLFVDMYTAGTAQIPFGLTQRK
jgi:hypothetical protein